MSETGCIDVSEYELASVKEWPTVEDEAMSVPFSRCDNVPNVSSVSVSNASLVIVVSD